MSILQTSRGERANLRIGGHLSKNAQSEKLKRDVEIWLLNSKNKIYFAESFEMNGRTRSMKEQNEFTGALLKCDKLTNKS